MERKLATIEKISEIHPIPNADAIERAVIRGWNVVTRKDEFKVGDLCVYCEIDSLMPERPEFEFLRPRGFRIRTIKLRNQISQGIAFPISILPAALTNDENWIVEKILKEGTDVTELLGIVKYEPPIPAQLSGLVKGTFPSHSIKSDEERIQNLIDRYEDFKKEIWIVTEKLDGCLDENTILETENGEKTIKEICEIKYSGKIKTFNLETLKEEYRKVLFHSIIENENRQWFEIELENGIKIKLTGNHKIWISNLKCWRRVDELDGDEIILLKN